MSNYLPSIPGQGEYLQTMSGAQSAYEKAVAKLTAQRRQQQYLAGLNADWSVDPMQQYGGYQQMLQNEGAALNAANEQSQQRGLYGSGLAHQGESSLRYGQAVEQLGFKNQLSDWENQYNLGMAQAKQDQAAANLAAQQQAMGSAYSNEEWTPYYPSDTSAYPTDYGTHGTNSWTGPTSKNIWNPAPSAPSKPTPGFKTPAKNKPGVAPGMAHGGGNYVVPKPAPKPAPKRVVAPGMAHGGGRY